MLVKSQHLESKGKKIKSSRSFLAITGSSRSAWATQDDPGTQPSRTFSTLTDSWGQVCLRVSCLQGQAGLWSCSCLKTVLGLRGQDLLSPLAFGAVRLFVLCVRSTILLLL